MLLQEHIIFINPTSILSNIIFIQRKSTYYELFALIQPLFPIRKDYFHQNKMHLDIIHCILAKGKSSFHFSYSMISSIFHQHSIETAGAQTAGAQKSRTLDSSSSSFDCNDTRIIFINGHVCKN